MQMHLEVSHPRTSLKNGTCTYYTKTHVYFFAYTEKHYSHALMSGQRGSGGLFGQKDPFEVHLKMTIKNEKQGVPG